MREKVVVEQVPSEHKKEEGGKSIEGPSPIVDAAFSPSFSSSFHASSPSFVFRGRLKVTQSKAYFCHPARSGVWCKGPPCPLQRARFYHRRVFSAVNVRKWKEGRKFGGRNPLRLKRAGNKGGRFLERNWTFRGPFKLKSD